MPAVISGAAVRYWLTWLAFFGAVVATLSAAAFIPMFVEEYGRDFPRSLTNQLPVGTAWLLDHLGGITLACRLLVAAAIVAAAVIVRRSKTRETSAHSVALVALLLYHVALMAFLMFVVLFFMLPHAPAGS